MILQIGKPRLLRKTFLGFTLIELLLVVAILVTLAGLNIPALSKTYNRLKIENCALDILSICRYGRQKAIVESKIHRLNFDLGAKTYWITREADAGEFERINGRFSQNFKIPADISIDVSPEKINFYPNGESDAAVLLLTGPNNLRFTLTKSEAFDEFQIEQEK